LTGERCRPIGKKLLHPRDGGLQDAFCSLAISGSAETGKDDAVDRSRLVEQRNGSSLAALLGPHHLHRQPLPLAQTAKTGLLDYGDVYKHILSTILANHESEPLLRIEPLHGAFDLHGGCRIGASAAVGRRALRRPRGRARCRTGTRIDRKNRRDLAALLPLPDLHAQLCFRFDCVVSGRLQRGNVEKRVAGAVGQLNEPEALVRSEPLDDGINGGAAWCGILSRRALERPLRPFRARWRWRVEVIVKAAASRTPISSFSHAISPFVEAVCHS
jgi:hypothetical protein